MSEFWLWFLRPIAEFLGGIVLFAIVAILYVVAVIVAAWRDRK